MTNYDHILELPKVNQIMNTKSKLPNRRTTNRGKDKTCKQEDGARITQQAAEKPILKKLVTSN